MVSFRLLITAAWESGPYAEDLQTGPEVIFGRRGRVEGKWFSAKTR